MRCSNNHVMADNCPNCGKKDSARTGNSHEWGHSLMCCSDECGVAAGKKIEKNVSTKKYCKIVDKINTLESERFRLKNKGLYRGWQGLID